jgi:DNA-binding XRE family transcriptional regulator
MSTSRTVLIAPDEDELTAENPRLRRLLAAMNRRVPSEEDRKLLLALGRTVRELREERGMTPAELACTSGIRRVELEAIEAGRPYPGRPRARRRTSRCS